MKLRHWVCVLMVMCGAAVASPTAKQSGSAQSALESARKTAVVDGNLPAAIKQYQAIVDRYAKTDRAAAAEALLRMADAYQKLGDAQARTTYERIVRDYADQVDPVATARGRLASLRGARPTSASSLGLVCADCGDSDASISRDGRWLALTDWDSGDLAIRDMATGETHRLLVKSGTLQGFGRIRASAGVLTRCQPDRVRLGSQQGRRAASVAGRHQSSRGEAARAHGQPGIRLARSARVVSRRNATAG